MRPPHLHRCHRPDIWVTNLAQRLGPATVSETSEPPAPMSAIRTSHATRHPTRRNRTLRHPESHSSSVTTRRTSALTEHPITASRTLQSNAVGDCVMSYVSDGSRRHSSPVMRRSERIRAPTFPSGPSERVRAVRGRPRSVDGVVDVSAQAQRLGNLVTRCQLGPGLPCRLTASTGWRHRGQCAGWGRNSAHPMVRSTAWLWAADLSGCAPGRTHRRRLGRTRRRTTLRS